MPAKKRVFAVIPAYNEATRIADVLTKTKNYVDTVVVVDDHSRDDTYAQAKKCGVEVVRLTVNMGAGFATRTGCDIAIEQGADVIVTLDADGQHDPASIPAMVECILTDSADIVFGSRPRNKNMPLFKRIGNSILSNSIRFLFAIRIHDSQTGYHAFSRESYKLLRWESDRYGVVSEFVVKTATNRLRYAEVEVPTIYVGKNVGMGPKDALKAMLKLIKWRIEW